MHPISFKKFTKSLISGSIAQFDKMVVPFAKLAAIIKFSVAPTEILGNLILFPLILLVHWQLHILDLFYISLLI